MKQTRRGLLVLMILLAVVISLCVLPAHAANDTAKLILTPIEAMPDEQFKTTLCVAEGSEIVDFQIQLLYDTDVVRLVSAKASKDVDGDVVVNSGQQGVLKINYTLTSENTSEQMPIVDLVFATDEEIGVGGYEFLKENTAAAKSADRLVGTDLVSVPLECDFSALNIYGSGDVDLNGNVEIRDVTRLRQYLAKIVTLTDYQLRMADAYYDENVNVRDAVYIQQKLAEFDVQLGGRANIRFYDADGNLYATKSVVVGGELTKVPAVPERTGYSNGMWSTSAMEAAEPDLTSISKDVNLYAFYSDAPIIGDDEYEITYNLYNNDAYLQRVGVTNPNPEKYSSKDGLVLSEPVVAGYNFEGWFDGQGNSANRVTEIPAGTTGKVTLYARWTAETYTINYECEMGNIPAGTYKVNQNTTLMVPTSEIVPAMANYIFLGWTNEDGQLVKTIPAGTTGNQTFTSNWTSRRNMTRSVDSVGDPVVFEDFENGQILFAYELGTIENIPLYTIQEFNAAAGIEIKTSVEKTSNLSETNAKTIAKTVNKATTNSTAWTLSEDWNNVTSVTESYAQQLGKTIEEANEFCKTSSNTYSMTSEQGGSNSVTNSSNVSAKLTGTQSHQDENTHSVAKTNEFNVDAKVGWESPKTPYGKFNAEVDVGYKHSKTTTDTEKTTDGWSNTAEFGSSASHSASATATWNTSQGFSSSNSVSASQKVSQALSEVISTDKSYGSSYAKGGSRSEDQSFQRTDAQSDEYASTLTYFSSDVTTESQQFTTNGSSQGKYRIECAGTAHVFAIVGYDVADAAYYTYTYNVLDDETHAFLDYSYDGTFTEFENCILPFEIPGDIYDYVSERILRTEGLVIDSQTGKVTEYNGEDTVVWVPAYVSVPTLSGDSYQAVKVTGIEPEAFAGNQALKGVILSDFVSEIPNGAFEGCTDLEGVICPNVTKIGDDAFKGCTSFQAMKLPVTVTSVGSNAFEGVQEVSLVASNKEVAEAIVTSGAKNITLNISNIADEVTGTSFVVPETAESFALQGGAEQYHSVKVKSDARVTTINGMIFVDCTGIPLQVSSETLKLQNVSIDSPNYAILLTADNTEIELYSNTNITTAGDKAIVCKNINVVLSPEAVTNGVASKLKVDGNILACGDVTGTKNIIQTNGTIVRIDEATFSKFAQGEFVITFDANGGSVTPENKTVYFGDPVGELPIPTRADCTFEGWYTEDGTLVTAESVYDFADGITLRAHWKSGWVLASELPEDGTVAENKWTYNLATRIESGSSTPPPGYSQYKDPTWVWGPWGGWSGWQNSNPGSGDSRQVETRWIPAVTHTEWNYSRYNEYDYASAGRRGWNGPTQGNWGGHYCQYLEYRGWSTTRLSATGSDSGYTIYDGNWYNEESKTVTDSAGYTQYRYRDRSKVWTYYYQMIEAKESATEILPTDTISNVQHWIQYIVQ